MSHATTPHPATARALFPDASTILDAPESRFPLKLGVENRRIRELFHTATRMQWNPATDIDWDRADIPSSTPTSSADAARMYWSRRAWGEYGAISESPALQIRFCHEHCPPDMRCSSRSARRKNRVTPKSAIAWPKRSVATSTSRPLSAFQGSVATHGMRKMALDPAISLEGTIAALVCAAEEIAFDVFRHLIDITPNPVARQVRQAILRDEVRHCAFGWAFLDQRMPHMSAQREGRGAQAVIIMIEKVELNGYHSSWLAPDNPASRAEIEVDRTHLGSRPRRDDGGAGKAGVPQVDRAMRAPHAETPREPRRFPMLHASARCATVAVLRLRLSLRMEHAAPTPRRLAGRAPLSARPASADEPSASSTTTRRTRTGTRNDIPWAHRSTGARRTTRSRRRAASGVAAHGWSTPDWRRRRRC